MGRLVTDLRGFKGGAPADDIERNFRRADTDGSGDIDVDELHRALGWLGLAADINQTRDVMRRYDTDGSNNLELPEFRRLVTDLRGFKGGAPADDIESNFRRADTDGSGGIDVDELHRALGWLGLA